MENRGIDVRAEFEKKWYPVKEFSNFRELIANSAKEFGSRPAFRLRAAGGGYDTVSYTQLREVYRRAANALIACGCWGKKIAVVGANSFDWVVSYLAASTVGVVVPLDKELSAADLNDFIRNAECAACVGDAGIIGALQEVCDPAVRLLSWQDLRGLAQRSAARLDPRIDSAPIPGDQTRVIIFTSGTSGKSKGACLSQKNICADIASTSRMVNIKAGETTLSVLPLHHTYECTLNCLLMLSRGGCICYADSLYRVAQNLAEYKPNAIVVVPALLQAFHGRIRKSLMKQAPGGYKKLFETLPIDEAMAKIPAPVRFLIKRAVKKQMGGALRLIIVGGAELNPAIVKDFIALGIRVLQGYGLTECAPLVAGNNDFYLNPLSTGMAIPGVEMKIDAPNAEGIGEILVRGENIMLGYFRDEEATKKVFTEDGFFRTGDLGYMDGAGFLYITGRAKNVIVTSNGKKIYPEELEQRLSEYDEVAEVLVLTGKNERDESFVKAKILPAVDNIAEKLGHLPSVAELRSSVEAVVANINRKLPDYKRIADTEVLDEALERTTTRKVKRYGDNLK